MSICSLDSLVVIYLRWGKPNTIRWMDDLPFYILFNSVSVISGRWADDNERLYAMEPGLGLRRFRLELGSNSGPLDQ